MEHAGRTALVTGATGGLGLTQARFLAKAGAKVLMLDIKGKAAVDDLRQDLPADAGALHWVPCDLADPKGTKELVERLDAEHGGIDIVINNAAINPLKAIDAYDLAEWQRVQDINATACVAIAQATVPSMKKKGFGQIVNITTVTLNGGWENFTAYVGSKGTLLGLTRSLARELGRFGIRVNCISPGAIPTPLEQEVWADQIETYVAFLLEHQALKYRGSSEDVANAMMFLISEKARFVTGHNLSVDGGWWMH